MRQRYIGGMVTQLQRNTFDHAVRTIRRRGGIITTHDVADDDGLGAAYALKKHVGGNRVTTVPGSLVARTDPLVKELRMDLKRWSDIKRADRRPLIVVDTYTSSLLGSANGRLEERELYAIIDHHHISSSPMTASVFISNEKALSTCEMMASLIPGSVIEADPSVALALAAGIYTDTDHLLTAGNPTLRVFEQLAEISGKERQFIDSLAYPPLSAQTTMNLLKDIRNVRIETYRGKLIAVGKTTQEVPALLAIALNGMGVNVAVAVGSTKEGSYRLSFRVNETDAHSGLFANEIARRASVKLRMPECKWMGGHRDKAGGVANGAYANIVRTVIAQTKKVIDQALGQKRQ